MSRRLSALAAASAAAVTMVIFTLEASISPLWKEARVASLAYMWITRWVELLAQLLIVVAILAAVSHIFREVEREWMLSTPTR